jgi:hypothetical protein
VVEGVGKVDVEPFAATGTGALSGVSNKSLTDPSASRLGPHHGVNQERMASAVPSHIHKPDQMSRLPGGDPPQAL